MSARRLLSMHTAKNSIFIRHCGDGGREETHMQAKYNPLSVIAGYNIIITYHI